MVVIVKFTSQILDKVIEKESEMKCLPCLGILHQCGRNSKAPIEALWIYLHFIWNMMVDFFAYTGLSNSSSTMMRLKITCSNPIPCKVLTRNLENTETAKMMLASFFELSNKEKFHLSLGSDSNLNSTVRIPYCYWISRRKILL